MRRRDFIALAAGIMLARPLAALAQRGDRVRRIAVLMSSAEDDPEGRTRASAFLQGLRDLGWSDGHNLRIEWRWAGGDVGRIRAYAGELAELGLELVVANGAANLSAVRQAIRSDPDRVRCRQRSGRPGLHPELGTSRWQHHRLYLRRILDVRKIAGAAQARGTGS
jgi:hypothetical protein